MDEYKQDEPPRWVTIARYFSIADALFFKSVLEGHGIPAFLRGEFIGQLLMPLTMFGTQGGVELQVPEDYVEDAQALLERGNAEPGEDEEREETTAD